MPTHPMRTTSEQERVIVDNIMGHRDAFGGLSQEERADYAESVRAENEARAERGGKEHLAPSSQETSAPFVDVWHEDGFRLRRPLRVF